MMAVMLILVVYQTFQIQSLQDTMTLTTNAVAGSLDMSDWTENEKMMYEHHGTLPARLQGNAQQAPTMVGGC